MILITGEIMSAVLFDLDGVLYESDSAIKGAVETVSWFSQNNIPLLFLSQPVKFQAVSSIMASTRLRSLK